MNDDLITLGGNRICKACRNVYVGEHDCPAMIEALTKAVRAAVIDWNTLGPAKVGADIAEHIAAHIAGRRETGWPA